MLINNAVITGSFIVNGVDVTGITGSSNVSSSYLALSASYLVTSASYASTSASLSIRTSNLEATSSTLVSASSSFAADSASLSTRLTTDEANIATNIAASASFAAQSSSLSTRLTTDETNFTNLSSSFATTSGSVSSRVTLIEGQYATTGSNIFSGTQRITEASNAISFTSTASLYTDGGLRVSKDSFVSGTAYFNNVVVYGTSSIQYITSSQVNFGTNIITVNTDTPAVRFGGLAVFDSGSTQLTGSMLWDSERNHWIYSNPSGSSYNSAMLMNGPRNTGSLGNEQGTTSCALMMGQGGDHITSSAIFHYENATCFYNTALVVSGSGIASVGTTPSAWSGFTALQSGNGAVWSTGANNTHFSSNTYYDGANRIYISTGTATEYASQNGAHWWGIAASGTGGTAQSMTEYMRLNTTGLGIGTTNPGYLLDVCGTGRFTCNLTVGGATAATNVQFILNGVSSKAQRILFQNSGTDQWLLGAGAASETSAFEIYNATGTIALSINKSTNISTFTGGGIIGNNSNNLYLSTNSAAGEISFWGNQLNTRLMTLTGCGNLGIGCVPSSAIKLQVYQCDAALNAFRAQHVNGNAILVNASYNYYDAYEHTFRCMGGGATYLTIGATGNVGIGTTDLNYKLRVEGTLYALNAARFNGVVFSDCRLMVGVAGNDQTYANIFVGGALTSGTTQYALLLDPQLSGTTNYGILANARIKASTATTNAYGVFILNNELLSGASIVNNYGLYIANQTNGSSVNYALYSAGGANYFGGCVGIGTSDPFGPLVVYKSNSGGLGGHIILNNNGAAVANETAVIFGDGGIDTIRAAISSTTEGSPYFGSLKFKTGLGLYACLTTQMTITGAGNVGIGFSTVTNKLQVAGEITTHAGTNTSYYSYMNYLGTTWNFGSGETTDAVDFKICGASASTSGNGFNFWTQPGNTTPVLRLKIDKNGSVGIGTSCPKHNFDINSVLTNAGGFAFCNMVTAQGTWSTFACVGSDANVVTTITYTNTNDHNRSGVFIARWSYNDGCASLFIRSCLWNDSQNIVTLAFRNFQSGALQICVSGGGGDYRVQALTQGTKAT